ncbi:MAG: heat-inducible transcriptional repressor HrcA [Eubacterium sp.]
MISERRTAILNLIIEHYLRTGEPMGSKTLCQLLPYSISSATIRNEMAYLSELGFLEQRHTSGGRVPSKASYRYYVDCLMQPQEPSDYEKEKINEYLSINAGDPERLLADASKLLSEYTHCASFYCTLEDPFDCIQGIDLIPAGNSKAMLVMLTVGSKIKSSLINMPCPVDDEFRYIFYNIMNKYFIGTPLSEVNLALIQTSAVTASERIFDLLPVLTSLCSLCSEASKTKFMLEGETNLLSHKELGSDVYRLLSFLAGREQLVELMKEFTASNKSSALFIGDENPIYEMKNTSTVISKYTYGNNQKATLGIIGSMRIDYKTIIPRVRYIINTVDKLLSKGGTV